MKKITDFKRDYDFLARDFPCPVVYQGYYYRSVESAYQASRCAVEDRYAFTETDGSQAKELIKQYTHKAEGSEKDLLAMTEAVLDKFCRNPELLDRLLRTEYADIEETSSNSFWGIDPKTGKGENWYGKILESARTLLDDELKQTVIQYQNKNLGVGYDPYQEICLGEEQSTERLHLQIDWYTVPVDILLPPYVSIIAPEKLNRISEFHFAVLTGRTVCYNGKLYPVAVFNPELLKRTTDGIDRYELLTNITLQHRNTAQQYYYQCENAYVQARNLEAWLGCTINENQFIRDILEAQCNGSRYPYRRTENGMTIDYAIENISHDFVSVVVFDGINEFPLNIEKADFQRMNAGAMLLQKAVSVLSRTNTN